MAGSPSASTQRSAASSAKSAHTSEPSTSTGRSAEASIPAIRSIASVSGARSGPAAPSSWGPGRTEVLWSKKWSMCTSRNAGPRCAVRAAWNARCVASAMSSGPVAVSAETVTGASSGTWSNSCSAPDPQRFAGARPPITTIGAPEKCACVTALTPLVTPGPAVSTARPGERVSLPVASAAKAAVCSCRTSSRATPWSSLAAASYMGNT